MPLLVEHVANWCKQLDAGCSAPSPLSYPVPCLPLSLHSRQVRAEEVNLQILAHRVNAAWIETFLPAPVTANPRTGAGASASRPTTAKPGGFGAAAFLTGTGTGTGASGGVGADPGATGSGGSQGLPGSSTGGAAPPSSKAAGRTQGLAAKWSPPWTVELLERNLRDVYRKLAPQVRKMVLCWHC